MFAQRPQLLDAIRQRLREHDYVETDRHLHDDGRAVPPTAASKTSPTIRGRLFRKYVALFVGVVSVALLGNGLFEMWFSYQEHKTSLIHVQREADAAAAKIGQFIKEIESQVGWTTQLPWSEGNQEQRRLDGLRLLRQVPAIAELAEFDATGREQLRVSHLAMDVVGSQSDFSNDPKFLEAVAHKVYYGPVYFRHESEPYMTLALAGVRRDSGVSVAEVNLKLIWDVVSQIKVGQRGYAYVVDAQGRLIAHPDISLVLRNTDLRASPIYARAARKRPRAHRTWCKRSRISRAAGSSPPMRRSRRSAGESSSKCRSGRPMRHCSPRSNAPDCSSSPASSSPFSRDSSSPAA
jgi:hypothetical protein